MDRDQAIRMVVGHLRGVSREKAISSLLSHPEWLQWALRTRMRKARRSRWKGKGVVHKVLNVRTIRTKILDPDQGLDQEAWASRRDQ